MKKSFQLISSFIHNCLLQALKNYKMVGIKTMRLVFYAQYLGIYNAGSIHLPSARIPGEPK